MRQKKAKNKPNINFKKSAAALFSHHFIPSINKSSILIICAILFLFECQHQCVEALKLIQKSEEHLNENMKSQEQLISNNKEKQQELSLNMLEEYQKQTLLQGNQEQVEQNQQMQSLSQETLDAAAQQATEEAVAEAQKAMMDLEQKQQAEQLLDLDVMQATAEQQQSLLSSLSYEQEGLKEGESEENKADEQNSITTAVDQTLLEIQKLRIIDKELERAQFQAKPNKEQSSENSGLNEKMIEEQTINQINSDSSHDINKIDSLVQKQIEDQMNKMEDTQTLQQSFDILEYGATIENSDLQQEEKSSDQIEIEQNMKEELEKQKKESEQKQKEIEQKKKEQQSDIDKQNLVHLQSEAALDHVQVKQIGQNEQIQKNQEPLMPSKDAYKISMDETFFYNKPKQTKDNKQVKKNININDVVKKSIQLGKQQKIEISKKQRQINKTHEALELFKAKNSHKNKTDFKLKQKQVKINSNKNVLTKNKTSTIHKSVNLSQQSKNQPQSNMKKEIQKNSHTNKTVINLKKEKKEKQKQKIQKENQVQTKKEHKKHHKKHKKNKIKKSFEQLEKESIQLDNLFLTLREDLISQVSKKNDKIIISSTKQNKKEKLKDEQLIQLNEDEKQNPLCLQQRNGAQSLFEWNDYQYSKSNCGQAGSNRIHDSALKSMLKDIESEQIVGQQNTPQSSQQQYEKQQVKSGSIEQKEGSKDNQICGLTSRKSNQIMSKLLGETDVSYVQSHSNAPVQHTLLQLKSQSQLQLQAQVQATVRLRAQASAQAKAATQALAALGVQQKSHIQLQDQNLIDALKRTIQQLEAKKNPALAVAAAKKKAVNNIQKALTKKILTRLDDSQPLINVFSKMQSLSKMMPAIQDFERRLGILHQVEPILENAIGTLSKVVDLTSTLPQMPQPAPAPAPPAPVIPSTPDLSQLKALLSQAQAQQAPAQDESLGSLSGLGGLLGSLGSPSQNKQSSLTQGLEDLLGGSQDSSSTQFETPQFLAQPQQQAAPAQDQLSSLLGVQSDGGADAGLAGAEEQQLLSKLLGVGL